MGLRRICLVAMASVSALGVFTSAGAHAMTVFGAVTLPSWVDWALQIGAFVVVLPAGLTAHRRARGVPLKRAFRPEVQEWPRSLWVSTVLAAGYATMNLAVLVATSIGNPAAEALARRVAAVSSSYQAVFYLVSFMALYAAAKSKD